MAANKTPVKKVAVIGAGPAGLTAAYQLAKQAGIEVTLFEASGGVGGLAKSITLWGQRVDIGPHRFFSSDTRVNSFWLEVVGDRYRMVDRLTRILYGTDFFHYPLKPMDAFLKLGVIEAFRCIFSYLKEKLAPTEFKGDFETWVTRRFGKRLFEIFFRTYSEKLWGIRCDELDADFAAQRVKKLSLSQAIKHAFVGGTKHKTLVDQFAYPLGGTGMVYELMAEKFESLGGTLRTATPVQKVVTRDGRVVGLELTSGKTLDFDAVISSMPLSLLVTRLDEAPADIVERAGQLTFRSTILVYLNVASTELFRDNWLYVHSPELRCGRVTNFRNWVPELYGDEGSSILCLEFWCQPEDELWKASDDQLIKMAGDEIRSTGLIGESEVLGGQVYRIERCYPIYRKGYQKMLKPVEEYLRTVDGLIVIGRYGAFKYNNQDHSILMGLLAAENVASGAENDLWSVNTDYDEYQEASIITDTGLQKR
ncbi:MAG TPA: FAD-dependent oxidoreductase [Pyrinomonadaceae bacterium]|nr:FAD-dependent oxidoreductase [Pyrinomonadaceae bacterium]